MNKKVADLIAKHKCFYLGKIEATGGFLIPFILDIKLLYSDMPALRILGQEVGKLIKGLPVNRVAGIETASIPLATAISMETNIPMVYVRKKRKKYGTKGFIEGKYGKKDKIVLVDDVTAKGTNAKMIYENCKKDGIRISDMVVIVHDPIPKPWAEKIGLKFHQLMYVKELWEYLNKKGTLTDNVYNAIIDWNNNISLWQKSKSKWVEFADLVKSEMPEVLYPY